MLSAQALLDRARQDAGLDDYGDMRFAEGLHILIDSINGEAGLKPDNEAALERELLRVLVNRLRMQRDLALHPEILDEEIRPPVFITSLPRTGSTKLHRLMAATGSFNAMTFWHSYNFAPFPNSDGATPDPRIAAAEEYLQWLYKRAPLFQQYHPMYSEEAEEELSLLDAGFNSLHRYASMLNVPSYVHWILQRDPLQAFLDLRRLLQYLQWQHFRGRNQRWVLKTPSLFGIESSFAQVFPGMDFIVTHRHPVDSVPSTCALLCGVRQMYYDEDISAQAGEAVMYSFGELVKGHLQWRSHYPGDKVLDVCFADIMRDEIAVLDNIFAFLGMSLGVEAKTRVRAWIALDAERDHRRSMATLARFDLTPDVVEERFAGYIERYSKFLVRNRG